ncbi:MAG: ATP phosphoribosyltransferase regulatory subunit, partial [Aurantimonas sp.]|nr:ATP phosphoribosyltransferase regulatory subunit [Aurantimonas sp.]
MSAETRAGTGAPYDAELGALFAARGAARVDVPIIQPADPYLDTAGEA